MRRFSAAVVAISLASASLFSLTGGAATAAPHRAARSTDRLVGANHGTREAPPSRATTPGSSAVGTPLPMSGFGDIAVDSAHGRVYVSGGDGQSGLSVFDSSGNLKRTISGLPGASGMVLSPDGSQLYVALVNGDGIEQIDTSTLGTATPSMTKFTTGTTTCPASVAVTVGLVWFGYGCGGGGDGAIGALDPATGTVHLGLVTGYYSAPALVASPAADGVLLGATRDQSPDFLTRYLVTGGDTPTAPQTNSISVGGNFGQMAITPDGGDVVVADGGVYHHQVYSTADLSADGTYPTDAYPNSVAINTDGKVAAGINGQPDVWIFAPGAASPTKKVDLGPSSSLVSGGLAFAGTSVYAVTGDFGPPYALNVVSTLPSAALSITTAKKAYAYGGKVRVTVRLKKPGSNQHIAVYGTPYQGSRVLLKKGSFTNGVFTTSARVDRRSTFTALWGGNASFGLTSRSTTIKVHAKVVSRLRGYYATGHGYRLYHLSKDPLQVAAVLPNHAGDCLNFKAQKPTPSGGWKTFGSTGCIAMNSSSAAAATLTGTHAVGERVRFRAEWGGDAENLRHNGPWQYAKFTR